MKLIPAIVQDYYSNEVLMLAYVNEESYNYMIKNKETCFYSRSRQKLWHKGETSGNIQKIKKILQQLCILLMGFHMKKKKI